MSGEHGQGHFLEFLRRLRGWEIERLAEEAAIPAERLAEYERGEAEPSEEEVERLGAALGLGSWEERGLAREVMGQILALLEAGDDAERGRAVERAGRLLLDLDRVQREPKREEIT